LQVSSPKRDTTTDKLEIEDGKYIIDTIFQKLAYNIDQAIATSYTLVLHVALWLPITALGLFYFAKEGLSWNHLKTDLAQARQENAAV